MHFAALVDTTAHRLEDPAYQAACQDALTARGVLVLHGFLRPSTLASLRAEAARGRRRAYFCEQRHTVYLEPPDAAFAADHPRNRQVVSTKGCICDDAIAAASPLRRLYDAPVFKDFLCRILGERALYAYADPLSSINLHYAGPGQELGWHFDNSSFAITLLIDKPDAGGVFEYVSDLRDADAGDMNYAGVEAVLDGRRAGRALALEPGDLVVFRGRNALHRVTPVQGQKTRTLAVLAYNAQPGIALSEAARRTFYGRTG